MRRLPSAVFLLALFTLSSAAKIPLDEFAARRASLRKSLDGVLVLFAQTEGKDEVFRVPPDANFYYLTGWNQPGAVLLLTPKEELLFLPHHDLHTEQFHGKRASAEDAGVQALTGFEAVFPREKFESELSRTMAAHEKVYAAFDQPVVEKMRNAYPFRDIHDAVPLIVKLRVKKSERELAAIQHATDVSLEAHRASWKRIAAGLSESQLASKVVDTFLEHGCDVAYAPIVGSGPNSIVLHYSSNQRKIDNGEVVVLDAAAECDGYASDITRTVPVSGKFSPRQREIYQVVLGAQKAAIAALKPGMRLTGEGDTLTKLAKDYMNAHGKDLHGEGLGKYFIHGLGHQVGLQVHDPNINGPLEAGMVVTIEPGIYIEEEGIGVRIEDVVLVTENGAKVLSAALPREPDEIEKAVAK